MTDQIGTHGLSCIGDDDYAAYALSMQCNAEATDAALADSNAALEEYLARPWVRVVNTNTVTLEDDTAAHEELPSIASDAPSFAMPPIWSPSVKTSVHPRRGGAAMRGSRRTAGGAWSTRCIPRCGPRRVGCEAAAAPPVRKEQLHHERERRLRALGTGHRQPE